MSHDTPTQDLPSFTDAVATFTAFLEREGAPPEIVWISREDVTSYRRRIWIRLPDPEDALQFAHALYQAAKLKGLGASLRAVCSVGSSIACYVWSPRDETAASYAMQPRSLKCQVPVPLIAARVVKSAIEWRLIRLVNRYRQWGNALVSELPRGSVSDI